MTHLFQVGAGSGGMPVLDLVCRDPRITRVTLVEPDVYSARNVVRHLFPLSAVGQNKAALARDWLLERRPDLQIAILEDDLLDPKAAPAIEAAVAEADIGICAADNEPAKLHFDALMRYHRKPWTLGEVLSGGIGGFVHWFVPGGPCYGCVAAHLQRSVRVDADKAPDYSQPAGAVEGAVPETTIPATKASIAVIAALHAQVTLQLLTDPTAYAPGFSSMLFTLERVAGVFDEMYRPFRFRIERSPDCLICRAAAVPDDLDAALDQALARMTRHA
jgi:molybdopterin/thiamine biosynthesis adenylyltransferase